jgi:hypothetical protein
VQGVALVAVVEVDLVAGVGAGALVVAVVGGAVVSVVGVVVDSGDVAGARKSELSCLGQCVHCNSNAV